MSRKWIIEDDKGQVVDQIAGPGELYAQQASLGKLHQPKLVTGHVIFAVYAAGHLTNMNWCPSVSLSKLVMSSMAKTFLDSETAQPYCDH